MVAGDPQSRIEGKRRTVALDVRSWKLGFVVLDGLSLIDWGVRRFRTDTGYSATIAEKKLSALVGFYQPTTIVIRRRSARSKLHTPRRSNLLRIIHGLAAQYSANVEFVGMKDIRSFFAPYGRTTKHGISTTLAGWFEELARSLPPKRKAWESEHHNAAIFDAGAAAMTFLALKSQAVSTAPQLGE